FFFFSSRRRHTRLQGDWSSDVCSSDLDPKSPKRNPKIVYASNLLPKKARIGNAFPPVCPELVEWITFFFNASSLSAVALAKVDRSEERRVGKECRCRVLRCCEKKSY